MTLTIKYKPCSIFNAARLFIIGVMVLLYACENRQISIADKQAQIKKEMESVSLDYYRRMDSLQVIANLSSDIATINELDRLIRSTDQQRIDQLLILQKKYNSLASKLPANP